MLHVDRCGLTLSVKATITALTVVNSSVITSTQDQFDCLTCCEGDHGQNMHTYDRDPVTYVDILQVKGEWCR